MIRRYQKAFTLIEVLIALAILAIALVAVIKVTGQGANTAIHVKKKVSAHYAAMNVLAKLQVGLIAMNKDAAQTGEAKMLGLSWKYKASVAQGGSDGYQRVLIKVMPLDRSETVETLTGFVLIKKDAAKI